MSTRPTAFDPSQVSTGTWVALGSAVLLVIAPFLDYTDFGGDGWSINSIKVVVLLAIAAIVVIGIQVFTGGAQLPLTPALLVAGCGGAALAIMLVHLIDFLDNLGLLAAGFWLTLLGAIGLAIGGYLKMQQE